MGEVVRSRPYYTSRIAIFVKRIRTAKANDPNKKWKDYTVDDMIKTVVAHEVGHAINLEHCPVKCLKAHKTCVMRKSPKYTNSLYLDNGVVQIIRDTNIKVPASATHNIDYDLAGLNKVPQYPWDDIRVKHSNDKKKTVEEPPIPVPPITVPPGDITDPPDTPNNPGTPDNPDTPVNPGDTMNTPPAGVLRVRRVN